MTHSSIAVTIKRLDPSPTNPYVMYNNTDRACGMWGGEAFFDVWDFDGAVRCAHRVLRCRLVRRHRRSTGAQR